jgi:hypothetical protein
MEAFDKWNGSFHSLLGCAIDADSYEWDNLTWVMPIDEERHAIPDVTDDSGIQCVSATSAHNHGISFLSQDCFDSSGQCLGVIHHGPSGTFATIYFETINTQGGKVVTIHLWGTLATEMDHMCDIPPVYRILAALIWMQVMFHSR